MSYSAPSAELLSLSQTMLLAVEAGDWDKVGKIEVQRQAVLKKVKAEIAVPGSETSIDAIADDMREVLSLNKRMIALGERVKAGLVEAMGGLSQGRKAVNAYYGVR